MRAGRRVVARARAIASSVTAKPRARRCRAATTASAALTAWCRPARPTVSRSGDEPAGNERSNDVDADGCVPHEIAAFATTKSRPSWMSGARRLEATASIALRAEGWVTPQMTGQCRLMMPAFSVAIAATVRPRSLVWSRLMLVMIVTRGWQTFVASRRPPRPVSRTAISTSISAKWTKAAAVMASNHVGPRRPSRCDS